ncbi:hypothetical protein FLA_0723 [Filimonas lacunae]|nr:hypothetical protein FLA_0723 [Filimonas lacunae]
MLFAHNHPVKNAKAVTTNRLAHIDGIKDVIALMRADMLPEERKVKYDALIDNWYSKLQ